VGFDGSRLDIPGIGLEIEADDVVEMGQSKSQRDRRKQVLAVIEDQNGATVEAVTDIIELDETKVERDIDSLKQRGQVYEIDGELRKS